MIRESLCSTLKSMSGVKKVCAPTSWCDRGDQSKIYCQDTVSDMSSGSVLTVRMGLTEVGNQTTPIKYSEKHDLNTHLTIPLSHLTSCTLTKPNLCIANSLAAAISEPALYRLLIFQVQNLVPLSLLNSYQISV
jgi:hypothetical protein